MRGFAAVVALVGVGCFNPHAAPGAPCSETEPCPTGQTCVENVCQRPGVLADDAAVGDAALDALGDAAPDAPPDVPPPDAPIAAPEFVALTSLDASTASSDVPSPTGTAVGDGLLALVSIDNASLAFTPPLGWVKLAELSNANVAIAAAVYGRIVDDPAAVYTWGFPSAVRHNVTLLAYRHLHQLQPIDDVATNKVDNADLVAPSVTATRAPDRLVTLFVVDNSMGPVADIPGMTERFEHYTGGYLVSGNDEPRAQTGATGTRTATIADPGNALCFTLLVAPP